MEPISLIVSALVAGAVAASKDVAEQAIKDCYSNFKALLKRKFGQQNELADAIALVEARPDSEGRKSTLSEEIVRAKADQDAEVIENARKLIEVLRAHGQAGGTNYAATLHGSGAIAQGNSMAAGERGVVIGREASNSTIVSGDGNMIDKSSTAFDQRGQTVGNQTNIDGDVNSGRDFVGRDINVYHETISGTIGASYGSSVAVGRDIQQSTTQPLPINELESLFANLLRIAATATTNPFAAIQTIMALKDEVSKGPHAEDKQLAKLIERFAMQTPTGRNAVVHTFASPLLAGIAGPATQYVLEKIQEA